MISFSRYEKKKYSPSRETGKGVENLTECIAIAKELSQDKNHALKLKDAKERGVHILIPQFGRALTEYMVEGLRYVEEESDLAPNGIWNIYSDSYTRKVDFRSAAAGIERSRKEGMSMLNGWPIVNFGVEEARRIKKATTVPLTLNSTDEDGRLANAAMEKRGHTPLDMRVIMKNGKEYLEKIDFVPGFPEKPLSKEELEERFRDCVAFAAKPIGDDEIRKIIDGVDNLEAMDNVRNLVSLLEAE